MTTELLEQQTPPITTPKFELGPIPIDPTAEVLEDRPDSDRHGLPNDVLGIDNVQFDFTRAGRDFDDLCGYTPLFASRDFAVSPATSLSKWVKGAFFPVAMRSIDEDDLSVNQSFSPSLAGFVIERVLGELYSTKPDVKTIPLVKRRVVKQKDRFMPEFAYINFGEEPVKAESTGFEDVLRAMAGGKFNQTSEINTPQLEDVEPATKQEEYLPRFNNNLALIKDSPMTRPTREINPAVEIINSKNPIREFVSGAKSLVNYLNQAISVIRNTLPEAKANAAEQY